MMGHKTINLIIRKSWIYFHYISQKCFPIHSWPQTWAFIQFLLVLLGNHKEFHWPYHLPPITLSGIKPNKLEWKDQLQTVFEFKTGDQGRIIFALTKKVKNSSNAGQLFGDGFRNKSAVCHAIFWWYLLTQFFEKSIHLNRNNQPG